MLIGDQERERAAAALRRHFASGRLSVAELSERVDLTLRARSRRDLSSAMAGLPMVWEDLPAVVHHAADRVHRGVRRVRLLLVVARVWTRLTFVLALLFGVALIAGAPVATALGAFFVAWALAGFATWRVCRRSFLRL